MTPRTPALEGDPSGQRVGRGGSTGHGAMSATEVHRATLVILAVSTAHVMTVDEMIALAKVTKQTGVSQSRGDIFTGVSCGTA
jgi:hypothetical protein